MKKTKLAILAALAFLLLLLEFWLIILNLNQGKPLAAWALPVIVGSLGISLLSFFYMVSASWRIFSIFTVAGLLGYLIIAPASIFVWLGGLAFFLLQALVFQHIKSEEKARASFSIRRVMGSGIMPAIYALLLMFGFNLYYSTSTQFNQDPEEFYGRLETSVAHTLPYLDNTLPSDLNLEQTLDEFLIAQVSEQSPDFARATRAQQEQLLAVGRTQFFQQFNLEGRGDEKLSVIFARAVVGKLKDALAGFQKFFPLIFTVAVLALLRTLTFVLHWLAMLVGWLLFKVLVAVNFFRISKVQVEVEKLEI